MPRRPRPRNYGQKGHSKKGHPRGWHRKAWSPDVKRGIAWLFTDHETQAQEDAA